MLFVQIKDNKDKGRVLYSATIVEKPAFQMFQRNANSGRDMLFGFFGGGSYVDQEGKQQTIVL